MLAADFIKHVLEILNEADASISGAELVGAEMVNISTYIEKLYPAAWRAAVKIFPRTWFLPVSFANATKIVNAPDGTGYIILPVDFLVLSSFKMTGWKIDVLSAPEETPDINKKQSNEYLRGTHRNPVCVLRYISFNNALRKAMYYYSLPKTTDAGTHVIEKALYVANVTTLGTDVDIDDNGLEPLAYLTAATVLTSFEKETAAKAIESKILEMI
jgi:hypothetical protein